MRRATPALLAGACALLLATATPAATLIVPTPDNPTIAAAIGNAASGDAISILPGVYREKLTVPFFKSLSFRGNCGDPASVIVDAGPVFPGFPHGIGFRVNSANTLIECLTVRHGTAGIFVKANDVAITNVRILHQTSNLGSLNCQNPLNAAACSSAGDGIHIEGNRFVVTFSRFSHQHDDSLEIIGNIGEVSGNAFDHCGTEGPGDCIELQGNLAEVEQNVMSYGGGDGIKIRGDQNTVRFNDAHHMDDDGLDASGNDNTLQLNTVGQTDDEGVEVNGNGNLIMDNTVSGYSGDETFQVFGDDNEILGNAAENADEECFLINGNDLTIAGNSAKDCDEEGFDVTGNRIALIGNTVEDPNEDGFLVNCFTDDDPTFGPCEELSVVDNVVITGPPKQDAQGFDIFAEPGATDPTILIDNNTSNGSAQDGFRLRVNEAQITNNTARNAYDGFDVDGDDNLFAVNLAANNSDDGFSVDGNGNEILGNEARDNLEDGVDAGGGGIGNTIEANYAERNGAEGIQNDGTLSILRDNAAIANRKDCARGTGANAIVNTGNFCADGSTFLQGQQIDD